MVKNRVAKIPYSIFLSQFKNPYLLNNADSQIYILNSPAQQTKVNNKINQKHCSLD